MLITFLGPPGSGKGTQCRRLAERLAIFHLSTGDALRQTVEDGTPTGIQAAQYLDAGRLVPDEVVVGIVTERLGQSDCENGCLLDGFPRTVEQAGAFDEHLRRMHWTLDHVLVLEVPDEELERRMLKRANLESRTDDTPETIARRMEVYRQQTQPLVDYYRPRDVVTSIDGSGSVEDVFERICQAVGSSRG